MTNRSRWDLDQPITPVEQDPVSDVRASATHDSTISGSHAGATVFICSATGRP